MPPLHTRMYGNYPEPVENSEDWNVFKEWQKSRNMVELVDLYDVEMNEWVGYMRCWNG